MIKPLSGCGWVVLLLLVFQRAEGADRMIAAEYKPNAKVKTSPSHIPPVRIFFEEFKDERPQPQQVGENLENKAKRVLVVTGDPRAAGQLVRTALQTELRKKGFQTVDQGDRADKLLSGTILKFWTVETNRYHTQTELRVEVRDAGGKVTFSKVIAGIGKNFGRSLSEVNYNESFSDSLVMIIDFLLGDPEFLQGLADKPPPPPAPSVTVEKRIAKPTPVPGPPPAPPVRQESPPPSKTAEPAPAPAPPAVKSPPHPVSEALPAKGMTPSPALPEAAPKGPPPVPSPPLEKEKPAAPSFIEHLVVPGETLATIAKWYAGEATAWTEIAKHNPGMHPFRLKGGEIVKVPRSLATVHTEQPAFSTAPETVSRPAKKAPKPQPTPPPTTTPEPAQPAFGPK
jgi:hypothetical protein